MRESRYRKRGLTADNVGEREGMQQQCGLACRSSVESSPPVQESIRRFLCVGCRAVAYLCPACDRGQRSPTCARTRLGVERSASLIGVTKAVSVGASSTLNGPVDIVNDAGA
jgi:hypothetical protein